MLCELFESSLCGIQLAGIKELPGLLPQASFPRITVC